MEEAFKPRTKGRDNFDMYARRIVQLNALMTRPRVKSHVVCRYEIVNLTSTKVSAAMHVR